MSIGFGDPDKKVNLVLTAYVVGPFSVLILSIIMWRNAVGYGVDHDALRIWYFVISCAFMVYSIWRIFSAREKLKGVK